MSKETTAVGINREEIENLKILIDEMRELHEYFNGETQVNDNDGLSLSLDSLISEVIDEESSEKSLDQSVGELEVASVASSLIERIEWPITDDDEILKDTSELAEEFQLSKKTLTRMVEMLFAHEEVEFRIKHITKYINDIETLILEQEFIKINLKRLQDYIEEGLSRKTKFDNLIDLLRNKTKPRTKLLFLFPKKNLWQLFNIMEEHYEAGDRLERLKDRKQIFRDKVKCFLKPLIKIVKLILEERTKEEERLNAEIRKSRMTGSIRMSTSIKSRDTNRETKMDETSRGTRLGDASRATKFGDTSRETKMGDTNRATKFGNTNRETKMGDTSRETKMGDTSRETKMGDTSRETKMGDITRMSTSTGSDTFRDTQFSMVDDSITDVFTQEEVIVIDEKGYIISKEFWENVLARLEVVLEECEEVEEQDNIDFKEYLINMKENKNVEIKKYLLEMLHEMEIEGDRDHCDFFKPEVECVINLSDTIETIRILNEYDLLYSMPVIIHLAVEKDIDDDLNDDNENGDEVEEEEKPIIFPKEVIWCLAKLFREYHLDELDSPKCSLDQEVRRRKQAERAIILKFEGEERERRKRLEKEIRAEMEDLSRGTAIHNASLVNN